MNNVIMRKIDVTGSYQPLSTERLVGSVTISTPPTNLGEVLFKAAGGPEVPWIAGEWHTLRSVNLADIEVKGTVGDMVTVVGGSW